METPEFRHLLQNLDYGHIYVIGNPKQTHNLRWFASMIEPTIRPLSLKWVESWDVDHTVIAARRFNVGNMGRYATVQLHLNRYGRSDSYSLLAAVHTFSDCLSDVMDDGQGDVIINEREYSDRNEPPHGAWGASTSSTPLGNVLDKFEVDSAPQDHTRVELKYHDFYLEGPETMPEVMPEAISAESQQLKREASEPNRQKMSLRKRLSRKFSKTKSTGTSKKRDEDTVLSDDAWLREEAKFREAKHREVQFRIDEDQLQDQYMIVKDDEGSDDSVYAEESCDAGVMAAPEVEEVDLVVEEIRETREIESEYERDVRDLRARIVAFIAKYHQDPEQVMSVMLEGKVLLGQTPGRLLVNGDMKIVLPDYDEMEIKMPAMARTLYILFMKQRVMGLGGFELKNIDQYRDEMVDIYSLVKPGADEERVRRTVDNLCDPFSNALNETISRANGFIRKCIVDKNLQKQYLISGARGEEYSIGLDPGMMTIPRALLQEGTA